MRGGSPRRRCRGAAAAAFSGSFGTLKEFERQRWLSVCVCICLLLRGMYMIHPSINRSIHPCHPACMHAWLSICLPVCLRLSLFVFVCLFLSLSVCVPLCLSVSLCVCLCPSASVCLSVCLYSVCICTVHDNRFGSPMHGTVPQDLLTSSSST